MDIREATEDDVSTIRSVAREAWTKAYADAVPESVIEDAVSKWYAEETMNRIIGDDEQVCLVAVESEAGAASDASSEGRGSSDRASEQGPRAGDIIGFVHGATDDEGKGDILRLYVHPGRWNEGIGSNLLETIERELTDRGAEAVQAMVLADNEMGNAFYEDHGFKKTGEAETQLNGTTRTENVYAKAD